MPDPKPRSNPLGNLWRTATGITDAAARTVSGAAEIATGLLRPTPGSSLVGPVTAMRRYRAVRVPLADVEQVCRKFDVTINDVALAAITEGFRSVLLHRGEQPRPDSLRTLVPVSVRSPDALDKPGNRLSIMLPYLPVEQDDPIQQLRAVHSRLTRTKQGGQRQAGNMAVSATSYVPFMCVVVDDSTAHPPAAARHRDAGHQRRGATPPVGDDGPQRSPACCRFRRSHCSCAPASRY